MDTNIINELLKVAIAKKSGGIDLYTLLIILSAIAPTLTALAAYLKAKTVQGDVKEVHLAINSRLDEWLETAREQAVQGERKSVADAKIKEDQDS